MAQGRDGGGGPGRGRGPSKAAPGRGKAGAQKKKKHASFKGMIRGCQRLLAKEDLDPKVRLAQEAKLADLMQKMGEQKKAEIEKKYAIRYHKIKFFDRVKAERHLKQLQRALKAAVLEGEEEVVKETRVKLEAAKQHVMYVQHFPKGEKYVSLFKGEGEEIEGERARLMALVRRQQLDLAVVTEADEGLSLAASQQTSAQSPQTQPRITSAKEQPVIPRGSRRKKAEALPAETTAPPQEAVQKRGSRRKRAAPDAQQDGQSVFQVQPHPETNANSSLVASAEAPAAEAVTDPVTSDVIKSIEKPADDFAGFDDFFVTSDAADDAPAAVEAVRVPPGAHIDDKQTRARQGSTSGRDNGQRNGRHHGFQDYGGARPGHRKTPMDQRAGGVSRRTGDGGTAASGKKNSHYGGAPEAKKLKLGGKSQAKAAPEGSSNKQPLRTRAEGGRKRRSKKN